MPKHRSGAVTYYTSDLLESHTICHAFFARHGGVSRRDYTSLNFKTGIGDKTTNVKQNRLRACRALNVEANQLVFANDLAHSKLVFVATKSSAGLSVKGYDGLITITPNLPLGLSVADCIPLLIASTNKEIVAIVHVGWRGLVAGIIPSAIAKIKQLCDANLVTAIGPAIAAESYEVGEELISSAQPKYARYIKLIGQKHFFDLPAACKQELRSLGINEIDDLNIDTYTNTDEFYSYRKEIQTGRMGAIISL